MEGELEEVVRILVQNKWPWRLHATYDETISRAGAKLPWQRLGTPEEIGRGIVFLCDPASDYITGSWLKIDGGITLPWWANRGSGVPD